MKTLVSSLPRAALFLLLAPLASRAFLAVHPRQNYPSTVAPLASTTADVASPPQAASQVLEKALQFKEQFGLFLVDRAAKKELAQAVEDLEASVTTLNIAAADLLGEWELLCTTSTTTQGFNTSMFLPGPLKQLSDKISATTNKYVTVQQIIKKSNDTTSSAVIDRVDHVLAYQPPQALTEFLDNVPQPFTTLNVNPLDVSKSKLVLVHKANTNNDDASIITLRLQSVIWNVAGTSTYLDPAGKDIAGINLPWGEFLGSGTFRTTYMDDTIRVSRGKQGPLDVLRVFKKKKNDGEFVMNDEVDDNFVKNEEDSTVIADAEIIEDIIMAEDATDDDIPSDVGEMGP